MNILRSTKEARKFAPATCASLIAAVALTGCGANYSPSEKFAVCTLEEIQGQDPVNLAPRQLNNLKNITAIRQAIRKYPSLLIDTAERIHPDGNYPSHTLMHDLEDDAHAGSSFIPVVHPIDNINNPGDIVCESYPLGAQTNKDREIFYDADGRNLLALTEEALMSIDSLDGIQADHQP